MFTSAVKKAHDAVEGMAAEFAFSLAAVLLSCAAMVFAAAGIALWLSSMVPIHLALIIVSGLMALVAGTVFIVGHRDAADAKPEEDDETAKSPLASAAKSLGGLTGPMDLVASGLFARQFKKHPVSTIAATAAVGALLGMMTSAADDD